MGKIKKIKTSKLSTMAAIVESNDKQSYKSTIPPELRAKANKFLNAPEEHLNILDELVQQLGGEQSNADDENVKQGEEQSKQTNTGLLLTLEVVFKKLLEQGHVTVTVKEAQSKYAAEVGKHYARTWQWLLLCIGSEVKNEAVAALHTSLKLLNFEAQYNFDVNSDNENAKFPVRRLQSIIQAMVSTTKSTDHIITNYQQYVQNLDILEQTWRILPKIGLQHKLTNNIFTLNLLALINVLDLSKTAIKTEKYFCKNIETTFSYERCRTALNKVWKSLTASSNNFDESVHRQILVVLIERFMPHLSEPILLTDFLMDSLNCGGAISLLALQGIFVLMQQHNITYPNVYDKLYAMFEPEIFHTKFKQRLFYLADIFLSSTHLPQNLVAAFIKRAARLCLTAPPQDIVIILYFIGNLLIRHVGLKRMICAAQPDEVSSDPFDMNEVDPTKTKALESSLWEVVVLHKHALPSVANAARGLFGALPTKEYDLGSVLENKESNLFNEITTKTFKQFATTYERPDDQISAMKYWKLF